MKKCEKIYSKMLESDSFPKKIKQVPVNSVPDFLRDKSFRWNYPFVKNKIA